MLRALHHRVRVHVHDGASDGLKRSKSKYVHEEDNSILKVASKNPKFSPTHLRGMDGDGEVLVLLEDGQLGAFVDAALVDGVGHGEVDDPAEEDAVADLGVEVAAIVAEGHYVLEAALVGQEAGVDPVGYGSLLLLRHHVVPVPMLGLLLDRLFMVTVWFVLYSNTLD